MFNFGRSQLIAAYLIVGLALFGCGILVARSGTFDSSKSIKFIEVGEKTEPDTKVDSEAPGTSTKICVHVAGKVKKAGIYHLDAGSRVMDAIKAAGGATERADLESINLAEKLQDGQQIYIAARGEIPPPKTSIVRGGKVKGQSIADASGHEKSEKKGPQKLTAPGEGTININTAGFEELQRLPGIGPAMAQRILDYRAEHGRFQSIEELDEVSGIGPKKLEKLRQFISL